MLVKGPGCRCRFSYSPLHGWLGIRTLPGWEMVCFPHLSRPALGPTQNPSWWIPEPFPGGYAAGERSCPPAIYCWDYEWVLLHPSMSLHDLLKGDVYLYLYGRCWNKMANGVLCDVIHTLCQGVIYFINVTGFTINVCMSFHPYRHGMYVVLCVRFYRTPICLTALNSDFLYEISLKSDNA